MQDVQKDLRWFQQRWNNSPTAHTARTFGPGAEVRFSRTQVISLLMTAIGFFALGLLFQFSIIQYLQALIAICTVFFVGMCVFTLYIVQQGYRQESLLVVSPEEVTALKQKSKSLPYITVMVAAFKEAAVMRQLVENMSALDYPSQQLHVMIVLEEHDHDTIQALYNCPLPLHFQVVVRPKGNGPLTKPGALNYAFRQFLNPVSEIIVVYDAEDEPDPLQLLQAVAAFRQATALDPKIACVQAQLSFSQNANTNWLTRMLSLDYMQHFRLVLPALGKLGLVAPLGGTSNFILTDALGSLEGWDPFNVTEDLDLAVRMRRAGLSVRVLASETKEEAVTSIKQFVNQRSRWIKGAMQTYFRHTRDPRLLWQQLGPRGFIAFQFIVGAPLLLNLINPWFWLLTALYALTKSEVIQQLYPAPVFYAASLCFVFGNFMYVYNVMSTTFRSTQYSLVIFALTAPLYWVLLSAAGYKAAWQFLSSKKNATKWEKTAHTGRTTNENSTFTHRDLTGTVDTDLDDDTKPGKRAGDSSGGTGDHRAGQRPAGK